MNYGAVFWHQLPKQTKKKAEKEHEDVLHEVLEMFNAWWDYTKRLHPIWERDHKLYNNERVEKSYPGVSDTFVPMTFSTIETMVAAIMTADLSVKYQPQDIYKYLVQKHTTGITFESVAEQNSYLLQKIQESLEGVAISDDDLEVLNAYFMYLWEAGDWVVDIENMVRSGLKIGTGGLWMTLNIDKPDIESVPFRDFIFDPKATSDAKATFMGRRYLACIDDLEDVKILNPVTRELETRFKNIEELKSTKSTAGSGAEKLDKQVKEEMFGGSTVGQDNDDQVEIIEIMTKERSYVIGNRKIVLEDAPSWIKAQIDLLGLDMDSFIPGITWANMKDESLLVGRSEISTFWKEQERLNDNTNQKQDAVTRSLMQNKRIDPQYIQYAKSLQTPGAVVPVPAGTVDVIPQDQVPAAAFTEEASIKNNIRETTATDQIVKGVASTSDVTATEARLQVANSGQRIELKLRSIERGPLKRLARMVLDVTRLFVDQTLLVPIQTNSGVQARIFDPKSITQDFEPKISLSVNAQSQKNQEKMAAVETLKIAIADPSNNLEAVKRIMYPKIMDLDKSEIEEIIKKPDMPVIPPEMGQPGMDMNSQMSLDPSVAQSAGVMA